MGPRTTIEPGKGPAAWLAADLEASTSWRRTLTEGEVADIEAALGRARAVAPDLALDRIAVDDFPLPAIARLVERLRSQLVDGEGVMILDGFPVDLYTAAELRAIWWGLSQHLGTPVSQSWRGDVIGDVRNIGTGIEGRAGRGYTSNAELRFHTDAADATGLFFLRRAKHGGDTRVASSVSVHNEIARRRPDLLEVLYQPFTVSWQSNEPPGEQPWYDMPVYGRVGDAIACAYVGSNILWAEKNCGAPPLTAQQVEAVELVAEVAAEPQFWIERTLEAGSMLFVNNHTAFHMRTEFEDHEDVDKRRHLLRSWLSLPNSRPLPLQFASLFGDVRAGAVRGGYPSRDGRRRFETS